MIVHPGNILLVIICYVVFVYIVCVRVLCSCTAASHANKRVHSFGFKKIRMDVLDAKLTPDRYYSVIIYKFLCRIFNHNKLIS